MSHIFREENQADHKLASLALHAQRISWWLNDPDSVNSFVSRDFTTQSYLHNIDIKAIFIIVKKFIV